MRQVIAGEIKGVTSKVSFCEKIGEFQQSITKLENGTRYPTIDNLVNACIVFKINPSWLLLGRGEMFGTGNEGDAGIEALVDRLEKVERILDNAKKPA